MKSLIGKRVYYRYSASQVTSGIFLRWCITKMDTGGDDTDKMGVGCVVSGDPWLSLMRSPGLPKGQHKLRPYWNIYRTYDAARWNKRKLKRPTLKQLRSKEFLKEELRGVGAMIAELQAELEKAKDEIINLNNKLITLPPAVKMKEMTVWVKED
jgi:hypothetical protein